MVLNCFKCKAEVVFDAEHIGKNGKKIPLDPATKTPHDCPMREKKNSPWLGESAGDVIGKIEEKDDHGKEEEWGNPIPIPNAVKPQKSDYVDHTLKGASKVKIFFGNFAPDVEQEYNEFLRLNKIKTQGAQFQISNTDDQSMLFAIALYYEEVAKQ